MENSYIKINDNQIDINLSAITFRYFFQSLTNNMGRKENELYKKLKDIDTLIPNEETDKFTFSDVRLLKIATIIFEKTPNLVQEVNVFHVLLYYSYLTYYNDIEASAKKDLMKYIRLWIAHLQLDFVPNINFKKEFFESRNLIQTNNAEQYVPKLILDLITKDVNIDLSELIEPIQDEPITKTPKLEELTGEITENEKESEAFLSVYNIFIDDYINNELDEETAKAFYDVMVIAKDNFFDAERYVEIKKYLDDKFGQEMQDGGMTKEQKETYKVVNGYDWSYAKGGIIKNYRDRLEKMSDTELADEYSYETGVSIEDIMQDIEDERNEYIKELVYRLKQTMKSRGEFAKGGISENSNKKIAIYEVSQEKIV